MKDMRISTCFILVLAISLAACAPKIENQISNNPTAPAPTPAPTELPRTPVIVDTDWGSNGLLAILYLLNRPEYEIKAVTIAGTGEAHCGPGTEHVLGLIEMIGAADIPVSCGRQEPLAGNHHFPDFIRENADSDLGLQWPEGNAVSKLTAPELIRSILADSSIPVTILTDGPLTNLADVFQQEPGIVDKIQMIYSMGGAIDVPGNIFGVPMYSMEQTAEFNIFIDPHAASIVLTSGAPLTLVPLDVTNQVPLDRFFYKLLGQYQLTPAAKAAHEMLTYTESYKIYGESFWDPLTYAIASEENLAEFTQKKITIVESGPEIGRTKVTEDGTEVRVAMTTNADRFMENYLSTLNDGAEVVIDREAINANLTMLTVTISGGKCEIEGSLQVPPGEFGIKLINQDQKKWAGLVVSTVDPDRSMADIEAWPSADQPPWLEVISFVDAVVGAENLLYASVQDKPLYLVCFDSPPDTKIGQFGPIELKQ